MNNVNKNLHVHLNHNNHLHAVSVSCQHQLDKNPWYITAVFILKELPPLSVLQEVRMVSPQYCFQFLRTFGERRIK